jgi:putative ABC transport system ATP-binding protein
MPTASRTDSTPLDAPASPERVAPVPPLPVRAWQVHRRFGEQETAVSALSGVSLEVPAGQFVAIMGPSGSGKSTLMHLLAGLDVPTDGTVELQGVETGSLTDRALTELRRSAVGFVFQSFNLLPTLSVAENVLLPSRLAGRLVEDARVEEVLEAVGVADRRAHRPAELSGGQQQRVAVARALVSRPSVMFADEPTGNLDSRSGGAVLRLLREAVDVHGQTTVMVTHDARAAATADRVLFLVDGVLVADRLRPSEAEILAEMAGEGR